MMDMPLTPSGVPILFTEDGYVPLSDEYQAFVTGAAMDDPAVLDRLEAQVRQAVHAVTGLDPDLPSMDWHMEFQMLLTINQFTGPLRVIGTARMQTQGGPQ